MIACKKCHKLIDPKAKFCNFCGQKQEPPLEATAKTKLEELYTLAASPKKYQRSSALEQLLKQTTNPDALVLEFLKTDAVRYLPHFLDLKLELKTETKEKIKNYVENLQDVWLIKKLKKTAA